MEKALFFKKRDFFGLGLENYCCWWLASSFVEWRKCLYMVVKWFWVLQWEEEPLQQQHTCSKWKLWELKNDHFWGHHPSSLHTWSECVSSAELPELTRQSVGQVPTLENKHQPLPQMEIVDPYRYIGTTIVIIISVLNSKWKVDKSSRLLLMGRACNCPPHLVYRSMYSRLPYKISIYLHDFFKKDL